MRHKDRQAPKPDPQPDPVAEQVAALNDRLAAIEERVEKIAAVLASNTGISV